MILKQFEHDEFGELNSHIVCFGKSENFLSRLIDEHNGILDRIALVVDNNKKNYGKFQLRGKEIIVDSPNLLESMDLSDCSIIITSLFYREIFDQLSKITNITNSLDCVYQFSDVDIRIEQKFRDKYANAQLEDIIIFKSGPSFQNYVPGSDFIDNARALFEYMLENELNKKYKLVWYVKNPEKYVKSYSAENVEFICSDWYKSTDEGELETFYKPLCLAKYLFFTDSYVFALNSRNDQTRVQLWHGCGFKTRTYFYSCEHRYEYTTVISDLYKKNHAEMFGLRDDQVLVTGYAKHDWFFKPYTENVYDLLGTTPKSKLIMWIPTFRTADSKLSVLSEYDINPITGLPIVVDMDKMDALNELLKQYDIMLLIKLHPYQNNSAVAKVDYSNILILTNDELEAKGLLLNRLLIHSDAMISDYSSAAVDYLNLDKPIAFTLDDVDMYEENRGFEFENIKDWFPGVKVFDFDGFCNFIEEISAGIDSSKEVRQELTKKMLKYRDGNNSKRILEALDII